ncbi:hypothetical protein KKI24_31025 [bacterium]|nr:hypothetical protein [bacterium]
MEKPLARRLVSAIVDVFRQSSKTSLVLFKIIIPITILTRLLSESGMIHPIGQWLAPVMELVGLPGNMGLVWATAMLTNLYAGVVVFVTLAPQLTVAQVTVLTTMMLVAHSLPVELRIAQKSGPRFRVMMPLRVIGAFSLGWILSRIYQGIDYLQTTHVTLWEQVIKQPGWWEWSLEQLRNLFFIYLIISTLILIMKLMDTLRITAALTWILAPGLRLLGMSRQAAPSTIIGMIMGIGYGGGLLIQEAQSGRLTPQDIFFSFTILGLFHSVIEDTLLMMLLGGHVSGIIWGRMVFALMVVFILVRIFRRMPPVVFNRYFFRQRT